MKSRILILLFSGCFIFNVLAQERAGQHTYNVLKTTTPAIDSRIEVASNGDTVLVSKYEVQNNSNNTRQFFEKTYKGTPFFKNTWAPGDIYFADGSVVKGTMAYNLVNNVVYYSLGKISEAVEAKPVGFTIKDITFKKLDDTYENYLSGYFETVFGSSKVTLFKQYSCIYQPFITGDRTGYESSQNEYEGEYKKSDKLFLGYNKNIVELKTNNGIYRQFGEYSNAMEKFGKKNKLSPKKMDDVIKLVFQFSNLIEEFEK